MIEKRKAAIEVISAFKKIKFLCGVGMFGSMLIAFLGLILGGIASAFLLICLMGFFGYFFMDTKKKQDYLTIKYSLNFLQPQQPMTQQEETNSSLQWQK